MAYLLNTFIKDIMKDIISEEEELPVKRKKE